MKDHSVKDLLPDLAAGRLDGMQAQRVEAHVAGCAECASELEVLRALAEAAPAVPDGLEARVRAALDQELGEGAPVIRLTRRRRWSPWLAAAAAVVLAVVAGTLTLDGGDPVATEAETELLALDTETPYGSLPGADGQLAGVATLDDLSEQELEELLDELEL